MEEKKLHITYLDFDDIRNPLLAAGQAQATYQVARRLVQKGHKVTVISSRFPGSSDRTEEGIEYRHIGLGAGNIKLNNFAYIFALPFTVMRLKCDIIIECFTAPISTLFSPVFTRIPVVVLPSMFNAEEFSRKYGIPVHLVERFGARFYKYMMPYSNVDEAKIKRMNPNIVTRIVPQGVGEEYLNLKPQLAEHILFLSRFDIAQKGIDLLLQAFAKIKDQVPYPLLVAGRGPDKDKIVQLIKNLGLESKVRMLGPLYGQEKLDIMSKAAFVAFPSRHDELSLWALEAFGAGLPVVAFDLPEAAWMGTEAALKAQPLDIDAYGKLLIEACDPQKNQLMRKAARDLAQTYSWRSVVDKIEAFAYEIINHKI